MSWHKWLLILIIVVSFFVRFSYLSQPAEVVFDEYYFGRFASAYLNRTPYFDIHPPLGKMMLGAAGWLFNIRPDCTFEAIGHPCPANIFFALRFLPALFGALLPLLFYFFVKELTRSKNIALISAFLVALENGLIVQSRHIFLDMFLLSFGILAIWLALKGLKEKKPKQWFWFVLSGVAMGACVSIKWTGMGFGLVALFLLFLYFKERKIRLQKTVKIAITGVVVAGVVYFLGFWLHFQLIPAGGEVDLYLGEQFKEFNFLQKTLFINVAMLATTHSIPDTHPARSYFYQWPIMEGQMGYWNNGFSEEKATKKIRLAGNPAIWHLSFFSILLAVIGVFSKKIKEEFFLAPFLTHFLAGAYFLNLLPFILIPRSTFLYHYFPAYLFAIIALAVVLNWVRAHNKKAFVALLVIIVFGFIAAAPLTYGFPKYLHFLF